MYGDGSAGPLNVVSDTHWTNESALPAGANFQFTDCTIAAGATLSVPSGTILRCSGSFTNQGILQVGLGALAGGVQLANGNTTFFFTPPEAGNASRPPGHGAVTAAGTEAPGGSGGVGMLSTTAWTLLQPGRFGGSGAAVGGGTTGYGGGSVVVLSGGALTNDAGGVIDGSAKTPGGGGGGIVILASKTSITQTGSIDVSGSVGRQGAQNFMAPGGGGGGGLVRLLAPVVTSTGTVDLAGGAGGTGGTPPFNHSMRSGGSGGGACAGSGGFGATIDGDGSIKTAASAGGEGKLLVSEVDPTSLF